MPGTRKGRASEREVALDASEESPPRALDRRPPLACGRRARARRAALLPPDQGATSTRSGQLAQRKQVVQKLRADKARLEHRLGSSKSIATLAREARALGYVRPGERLYIVKGINHWRKQQRASMMAHRGH